VSVTVKVTETFVSLQGESTWAGVPCFFIRLTGCNLRCGYCDTRYAYEGGEERPVDEIVEAFLQSRAPLAEITGGEPLLQAGFHALASGLRSRGCKPVLVETNGSRDLSAIPDDVIAIMDLKCPGSGASAAMDWGNIARLRPHDEVKFVIGDRGDFDWACGVVERHALAGRCHAVLFSPVFETLTAATLGGWVQEARLPVRLQLPLHKMMGIK
jgi:7-carboxy-7-deazaguanine synthase